MENPLEESKYIKGTNTYWKLRGLVQDLLETENKCLICGSNKDLEPHHVIKCSNYERLYVDEDNLIILCHKCHSRYHRENPDDVNIKSLIEFVKNRKNKKKKKIRGGKK